MMSGAKSRSVLRLFNPHPLSDAVWSTRLPQRIQTLFSRSEMGLRCLMSVLLSLCLSTVGAAQAGYQPPLLLGSPQVLQNPYLPPLAKPQEPAAGYVPPYAVPQQSVSSGGAAAAVLSAPSTLSAERTYSTNAVGSAIHKAPASEIESSKESIAKEKAAPKEEYVVYYYYYYDNDTTPNNNLSLNFDDIPTLEGYDEAKEGGEKAAATHLGNAVDDKSNASSSSLQARSASGSDAVIRADLVQPLKPVSNVFRYGSNEVPRFPVLPNFVVSEVATTTEDTSTPQAPSEVAPTTTLAPTEDDSLNNVLDSTPDPKGSDARVVEETTATTTTTTEPTTTEIDTTTTEKPRRRPSIGGGGGGRRRPTSGFSSNRSRPPPARSTSTSSTTSTSTTTTATPTRRSFQGSNRLRPRPPPRSGSRTTESSEDRPPISSESATTSSTTASSRSRFTSASPRRFQASRSRSQTSSTTTTTTRTPPSPTPVRSRPTSRPRPNLVSRNRPARPGFLRPRPGSEPEEPETTTPEPVEEASPTEAPASPATDDEEEEEESEETSSEEPEEATTTESSRFSALFRPRNRNGLGNRPRPVIGNRPSRS